MCRFVIKGKYVIDRKLKQVYPILIAKTSLQLGVWKSVFWPHIVYRDYKGKLFILTTK